MSDLVGASPTALVLAVFVLTYLGMALGRVPGLAVDRTGIALLAAVLLLATGALPTERLAGAIDIATLAILFGLMVLSAQFVLAGFYDAVAAAIAAAAGSQTRLLALTVLVGGLLSALLANDIVAFAMTPILVAGLQRRGLDPLPYLIALAGACNAGSAATLIGNPQNILIAQAGGLDFLRFLAVCGPPAAFGLLTVFVVVRLVWWRTLSAPAAPAAGVAVAFHRGHALKGLAAAVLLVGLFVAGAPHGLAALAVAGLLLVTRHFHTRRFLGQVDWPLLLLFAGLFLVNDAFAATGLAARALDALATHGLVPDRLAVLAPLTLLTSNSVGNVPAVILLLSLWPAPPEAALYGLALLSTLAGNLLLIGSVANIIIAERAAAAGARMGFAEHALCGVPITLVSGGGAVLWLWAGGWLPW